MEKFLPYAQQSIDAADIKAVKEALQSPMITRGEKVVEFEEAIARYTGAAHAVAFTSGSSALLAAHHVAEIGPSDKVLITPNTFIATLAPATQRGATPVFVDIDLDSGNFDLEAVANNLSYSSTRGKLFVLPVHFSGIAIDMGKLDRLIKQPSVMVIEDAAHALGSDYPDGQKVGSCAYSAMTIFSFHPAKLITTGEGGMVTTNDPELARRLRLFRNNGIEKLSLGAYDIAETSSNYNFTEFQAALGLSQLKKLDDFVLKRRKLVARYRQNLKNAQHIKLLSAFHDERTAYHLLVVQIDFATLKKSKLEVMQRLKERRVGTQYHYIPLYRLACYAEKMGDLSSYFPNMESYYEQALSLPLFSDMAESDVDFVTEKLFEVLESV